MSELVFAFFILLSFACGFWFGGWQVSRHWQRLNAKSLEFATFWQKQFYELLEKLPAKKVEAGEGS